MPTLTPPISVLCGMSGDTIFTTSGSVILSNTIGVHALHDDVLRHGDAGRGEDGLGVGLRQSVPSALQAERSASMPAAIARDPRAAGVAQRAQLRLAVARQHRDRPGRARRRRQHRNRRLRRRAQRIADLARRRRREHDDRLVGARRPGPAPRAATRLPALPVVAMLTHTEWAFGSSSAALTAVSSFSLLAAEK